MNKETKIQNEIKNYLNQRKIFHYRVNADMNTVGIPDLIACYRGFFLGIEVKTPKGKLSDVQKVVGSEIRENLGYFIVPTCVQDVKDVLKEIDNIWNKLL
jgi:Holliday junction resolvase